MSVRISGLMLAFISHLILSRTLGTSNYGHYVIALGWAMVLVIPARLGLDNSALRFATIYREERRHGDFRGLVSFSLVAMGAMATLIGCILLLAKGFGARPLQPVDWSMLVGMVLLIAGSAVLGWLSALIRTANRIFAAQFYEQVLRPSMLIAGIGFLAIAGPGPSAAGAMLLTGATVIVAAVGIAVHARAAFRDVPPGGASFEHRREWQLVSWELFLIAGVQELLNQMDVILLGILSNAGEAAHFAAAWRLASLVPFGLVAAATVSAPLVASAYNRENWAELARIARLSARIGALFGFGLAVTLAIIGKPMLSLFGPEFLPAYPALMILLAGGLIFSCTGSVGTVMLMTGHQREALWILAAALAIGLLVSMALIPILGATGSAIASATAVAIRSLAMAAFIRWKIGIDTTALGLAPVVKQGGDGVS